MIERNSEKRSWHSGSNDDDRNYAPEAQPQLAGHVILSKITNWKYVMSDLEVAYLPEKPGHDPIIESINAEAFGPGRFARAAYKIREGGPHDPALSFVAVCEDEVVGSVRQTWVVAGLSRALLLGPLAVRPAWKNKGIGRKLVAISVEAARAADAPMVILVGDAPYYQPLGFEPLPHGKIVMPRPVDPARLLVAQLRKDSVDALNGELVHADLACVIS